MAVTCVEEAKSIAAEDPLSLVKIRMLRTLINGGASELNELSRQ